ncbi:hypothetical protein Q8A73_012560 [Channa argus]|nr:hypothetical protein Q8A73_012560 [Channa argus]
MPFGLCNAPATFERLMERVLKDIPRSRCVVYLDDLLVHAKGFEDAINNLAGVFMAIRQAGLRLNPAKCHWLARETQFLGHVVNEHGVTTDRAKVAAIKEWPQPTTTSELRSFLGLASYYRRFVKDFATIASPLHRVTEKGRWFEWSEACSRAFQRLKVDLSEAPVLAYPNPQQPFIVDTDASGVGIGVVLSQGGETGERVVAYYSCSLSRPERNYCVTRRELLAVVLAVRHFRPYLLGTRFTLRTDHASLTWLLNFKQPEGQVARWLEILQEYDFDIQHRPGRQHGNADALSRRPCLLDECCYCRRHEERELGPSAAAVTTREGEPFSREQLQQHQEMDPVLAEPEGQRSNCFTHSGAAWSSVTVSSTGGGGHQVGGLTRTTPLHPQSDGLVERFNRTLATQLSILTSRHQKDWDQHLPLVLWAYRTAVQESSQCTPATLMFGRELRTPGDLVFGPPPEPEITGGPELDYLRRLKERLSVVHQLARESQGDAGARQKRAYDGQCHGHPFAVGDNVWVYCPVRKRGLSPKLTSHWQGPGEILDRISEVVYRVRMPGRGRRVVLHRDRLAPYHPLAPNPVTEPEDSLLSATPSASMNNGGLGAEPGTVSGPLQRPARARRLPGQLRDFVVGLSD